MLCITVFLYANKGLLCTDTSQLYQLSVSRAARTFMLTDIYKAFHSVLHTCNLKNIWHLSTNFDSSQLLKHEKCLLRDMHFLMGEGKLNGILSQAPTPELCYHGLIPPSRVIELFLHSGNNMACLSGCSGWGHSCNSILIFFLPLYTIQTKKNFRHMVFSHTWLPSLKFGFGFFFFLNKFISFLASDFTRLEKTMDYSYPMQNLQFKIPI